MKTITLEKELIPSTFLRAKYGFVIGIFCFLLINSAYSQGQEIDPEDFMKIRWTRVATAMPDAWYGSDQAKTVAENVLNYQTEIGGWAKNSGFHNNSVKQDEWERIKKIRNRCDF